MANNDFGKISQQIAGGKLSPVYLLHGEEDYYIDRLCERFEAVMDEMQKEFDFTVCYGQDLKGKEPGLKGVIANCKRFPVMSPFQMIIIKEAQIIDKWDSLEDYLQKPIPTTCLVICYKHKKFDSRKKVFKLMSQAGEVFESAPLKERDFTPWVSGYIHDNGYDIDSAALALLCDCLGSNLNQIANELQKLFINLPKGSRISEDHIQEYIGINKEYNTFTLIRAIGAGNAVQTRKICNYMVANPKDFPLQLILPQLYKFFAVVVQVHDLTRRAAPHGEWASRLGVPPYFLSQYETAARIYDYRKAAYILHLIRDFDLKSKGVDSNLEAPELLNEICFRVLYAC